MNLIFPKLFFVLLRHWKTHTK